MNWSLTETDNVSDFTLRGIEYFAPRVDPCVSDPDPLQLCDPRLLAVPAIDRERGHPWTLQAS